MTGMVSVPTISYERLCRAEAILDERDHQDEKWGAQQNNTLPEWMLILMEEVGELSTAILNKTFVRSEDDWRREAIQVAAVALAMVEQTPE